MKVFLLTIVQAISLISYGQFKAMDYNTFFRIVMEEQEIHVEKAKNAIGGAIKTSEWTFIPVYRTDFFYETNQSPHSIKGNSEMESLRIGLSQVLIQNHKGKIIGTIVLCLENSYFIKFYSKQYKHLSTIACRENNLLPILNTEDLVIPSHIDKGESKYILLEFSGLHGFIVLEENGKKTYVGTQR